MSKQIRRTLETGWTALGDWMFTELISRRLSEKAMLLYWALAKIDRHIAENTGYRDVTYVRLRGVLGWSQKTLRKYKKELEAQGWIKTKPNHDEHGHVKNTRYWLMEPSLNYNPNKTETE